jgi:hypothetical protein
MAEAAIRLSFGRDFFYLSSFSSLLGKPATQVAGFSVLTFFAPADIMKPTK